MAEWAVLLAQRFPVPIRADFYQSPAGPVFGELCVTPGMALTKARRITEEVGIRNRCRNAATIDEFRSSFWLRNPRHIFYDTHLLQSAVDRTAEHMHGGKTLNVQKVFLFFAVFCRDIFDRTRL